MEQSVLIRTKSKTFAGSIQKRLDDRNSDKQFEVNRIKAILPEGGVNSLRMGLSLTAGASAILEEALSKSEKETSAAHAIYERDLQPRGRA